MKKIRLATRGSSLALAQAHWVANRLRLVCPDVDIELVVVHTRADLAPNRPLRSFGDKGVFVREVQQAVLEGRADAAVHSLKDLPAESHPHLVLAAIPVREDPHDMLVTRSECCTLESLPARARIATSSLRRRGQILHQRPDVELLEIRGNVDTRLRKLEQGQADALVVAKAALIRLNIVPPCACELSFEAMLPAACQGALAVETQPHSVARSLISQIDDPDVRLACETERAFIRNIGADCRTPVACLCTLEGENIRLRAAVCHHSGGLIFRHERTVPRAKALQAAHEAAEQLLASGADRIMMQSRQQRGGCFQ
ncbi:MAG: hydroxymethylbilane synthase [Candidatus Sumerlaeaceae bacterium]|nr:hydroxymethylbilane synthase [Candidatus Sumerlaeaceae bacterium]